MPCPESSLIIFSLYEIMLMLNRKYKWITNIFYFPTKRDGTPNTDPIHKSNPYILEDDIKTTQELY